MIIKTIKETIQVDKYQTYFGKVFDSLKDAEEHQAKLDSYLQIVRSHHSTFFFNKEKFVVMDFKNVVINSVFIKNLTTFLQRKFQTSGFISSIRLVEGNEKNIFFLSKNIDYYNGWSNIEANTTNNFIKEIEQNINFYNSKLNIFMRNITS